MARFLFIHQNFPGQFRHLAPALAAQGHEVVALGMADNAEQLQGVRYFRHMARVPQAMQSQAPQLRDMYSKVLRGESAAHSLDRLKQQGFEPDVVFVHPGWGEALFVRDVFPKARKIVYAEYYYQAEGGDSHFDPEFSKGPSLESLQRLRLRNTHLLHAISEADAGLSPTVFQRDRHPDWFRDRISVIHDGIDTERFRPGPNAYVSLSAAGVTLRPNARVVIVGPAGGFFGPAGAGRKRGRCAGAPRQPARAARSRPLDHHRELRSAPALPASADAPDRRSMCRRLWL